MACLWLVLALVALASADEVKWWEKGIIYQIYPRSFKDSNNDGIGDLPGITSKLDYLSELGVSGVWLSPIYPSPMKDFGYDIADFKNVNPEYGTLDDFDDLVKEADRLGLRVIMDFVPNHSSDEHEWFIKSKNREPGFEDYYVWRDPKGIADDGTPIPPNNWLSLFYGSAWEYVDERGQFYLHQFAVQQPDLNYSNPAVTQEMNDVISFWLDRGVDGFRIDAIPFMFESPGEEDEPLNVGGPSDPDDYDHLNHIYTRDFQPTYDMVRQWRQIIDAKSAEDKVDRCIMVEAYASVEYTMKYFGTAEEPIAHFPFNFNLIPISNATEATDFRKLIHAWVDNIPSHGHSNWLVGNHDNHRVGSRVGADLIDAMNVLVLSLPGVAVTYYGEEIGMLDNLAITYDDGKDPSGCNYPEDEWYQRSRDFERTPFQWNASANAGFNEGAEPWLPVHDNYKNVNLEAEKTDNSSHYSIYRAMVELRKTPALRDGRLTVQTQEHVLAILRHVSSEEYVVVLINFSASPTTVNVDSLFPIGGKAQLKVLVADHNAALTTESVVAGSAVKTGGLSVLVLQPST